MPEKYWMVTNRSANAKGFGDAESRLSYWVSEGAGELTNRASWDPRSPSQFRKELQAVADGFPLISDPAEHERQRHVTLFVHGYNNDWQDAVRRYQQICSTLYLRRRQSRTLRPVHVALRRVESRLLSRPRRRPAIGG